MIFNLVLLMSVVFIVAGLAAWLIVVTRRDSHWNKITVHPYPENEEIVDFECNRGCHTRIEFVYGGPADRRGLIEMRVLTTTCPVYRRYANNMGQTLPGAPPRARVIR